MVIQVYAPTSNAEEAEDEQFYEDLQNLLEHPKKDILFIGDWDAKVGSQETPEVTDKFGLGIQKQKILRSGKNTQKNCTEKVFTTQITTMVWSHLEPNILE